MACTIVEEGLEASWPARRAPERAGRAAHARARLPARGRGRGTCGIDAEEIRRMARELAAAERAAVYARIGTCTQEFGTHASWLVDVLNVLTGNLDREGGAMFTRAAAGQKNSSGMGGGGRGVRFGRWTSRVRGLPELYGELPVAVLAEEIETPGDGQVRALITVAGNPVALDAEQRPPRGRDRGSRLHARDRHLRERDDRHADVILPAPEPLEKAHYDLALYQLAARNMANYSPADPRARGPGRVGGLHAARGRDRRAGAERRRRRCSTTWSSRRCSSARLANEASPHRRPRPRRAARGAGAAPRAGAGARLHAARRSLRRRLRERPRGPDARPARAEPARNRPRAAPAAAPGRTAHAVGQGGAGAGADRR